ncbi:hypothetical protein ACFYTQ_14990 [Nocardia sp. NPDC004068]|uniref:hypothetical protein n=1 Tax=Nocardia sp. NPDC004068 TaxID=3364303 RepID=UPI0036CE7AAD
MVSSRHEVMHRIFQHDPTVFARAFRALGLPFPDPMEVVLETCDLTEIKPVERRVDTVLRIESAQGSFLLLVEAQQRDDLDKPAAWAYYVAYCHAKYRIPVILVIVCHDPITAKWARRPIRVEVGDWVSMTVLPFVLGPDNVPIVTDTDSAAADIPLATLSAVTHAADPRIGAILNTLATVLKRLDPGDEDRVIFRELTELGLGATPAADLWRKLMPVDSSFFRSETARRVRAEARAEGLAEGKAEGLVEGKAEALTGSILRILTRRGIDLTDADRERITSCTDLAQLDVWLERAITAETATEVFGDR